MLQEKLMRIQQKLKAPKGNRNDFGKYNYRSCSDILEAVKPFLEAEKCTLVLNDEIETYLDRVYVKATAILTDCDPERDEIAGIPHEVGPIWCEAYAREPEDKKGMDASQITGTASSYARKYALCGLFAIDDSKLEPVYDADSNGHEQTTGGNGNYTDSKKKGGNVQYATAEEKDDIRRSCKENNINLAEVLRAAGVSGQMTAPQYAKAKAVINKMTKEQEG